MNEILGNRIKTLRIAKNLTQEQVAEILDVTVSDITRVLDETSSVAYRAGEEGESTKKIFDMLDLFYANKHMCERLQHKAS